MLSSVNVQLLKSLKAVIANHCPNEKLFCGTCTEARKVIVEAESVDSLFDQFYGHLQDCPKCSSTQGTGPILKCGVAQNCEEGNRLKLALLKLNDEEL